MAFKYSRNKGYQRLSFLIILVSFNFYGFSQTLQPGFSAREYADALAINFGYYDSLAKAEGRAPAYKWHYRSKVSGLDNRWWMWLSNDAKRGVITIRGTVATTASWLANVYAVMQPAIGSIKITDSTTFNYKLADRQDAAVHTGWLLSLGSMAADIENKIREQYEKGVKEYIITGHSQGAGIAYLLRSYIYYRTQQGELPADIIYKTYCSAAPKPGNLFYAYDYDFINRGGWAFTVVNAADWVPETPLSIQQFNDLNPLNPFVIVKSALQKQRYFIRVYANLVYNKLNKSTQKAAKRYRKYLGKKVGKQVHKKLPQLAGMDIKPSMNYMRAGSPVVLMPDQAYFEKFPNDPAKGVGIWNHHTFEAYYLLLKKDYSLQENKQFLLTE
ncbi:MAG TPA: lipase family protein [Flavisolibacter sp.]|nr:lipase family protein [Flavisolibacter sp.]